MRESPPLWFVVALAGVASCMAAMTDLLWISRALDVDAVTVSSAVVFHAAMIACWWAVMRRMRVSTGSSPPRP